MKVTTVIDTMAFILLTIFMVTSFLSSKTVTPETVLWAVFLCRIDIKIMLDRIENKIKTGVKQ